MAQNFEQSIEQVLDTMSDEKKLAIDLASDDLRLEWERAYVQWQRSIRHWKQQVARAYLIRFADTVTPHIKDPVVIDFLAEQLPEIKYL